MLRAMSSASWITRLALMPLAGSSSYIVTTGPGRTSTMSPRTWKSSSTDSSTRALRSSAALSTGVRPLSDDRRQQAQIRQHIIVAQRQRLLRARFADGGRGRRTAAGRLGHRHARPRLGRRGDRRSGYRLGPARLGGNCARLAREQAGKPAALVVVQAKRNIGQRRAGAGEQDQHRDPHRIDEARVGDQADQRLQAGRAGEAEDAAPAARQPDHRRAAGQPERDADQHRGRGGDQQRAAQAAGRLGPRQPQPGNGDHRQEQDRARGRTAAATGR